MIYHKYSQALKVILLVLLLLPVSVWGQKILISGAGQKILISSDGSWSIVSSDEQIDITGNIIENQGTSLDAFEAPSQGKHPLTVDQKRQLDLIVRNLLSDEAQLLVNYEFFKENAADLEAQVAAAKNVKSKDQVASLKGKLEATSATVERSKKEYENATKLIVKARSILAGSEKNADEKIAMLQKKADETINVDSGMGSAVIDVASEDNPTSIDISTPQQVDYPTSFAISKKNKPRGDYNCNVVHDGFDPSLDKKRKEVASEFFFGYSQPKMKAYFKSEDYITCDAHVSKVGKKYYITMDIRIRSKDAQRTYGILRSNETIRFELIDGSKVYCTNMIQDNGTIEAYTGHTLYTGIYEINKDDLDALKDKYLDNVGIIWSSGFEQYVIYNVDFLYNQLRCLEN